jgi:hypothetical protein
VAQLAEVRLKRWHQQGEALLTMENLRSWMNTAGLVLFAPRPQIVAPVATLVEAVLGAPNASPTVEQTAEARGLLGRLVAEGLAVPLNLMGGGATLQSGAAHQGGAFGAGDTPDFVTSTAVFSYVFTLRGDKAWKQPPATTGPLKVSHLALAVHEALTRRGALTAFDLAVEVGKEATEAAVLRALGELWTQLRVLPLFQAGGKATLWELASARFIKQMKAGANAGQPSALSALISLYLGQAVVAAEEEVEGFLSPLAPRSRIRDVVRALLSARQLETVAVEGRTMLHVAGELPAFLAAEATTVPVEAGEVQGGEVVAKLAAGGEAMAEGVAAEAGDGAAEAEPRITKFIPKPRKIGTGYLAKAKPAKFAGEAGAKKQFPAPKFGGGEKPKFGAGFRSGAGFKDGGGFKPRGKDGFKPRAGAGAGAVPDRERRPFSKTKVGGFDKPWEEEKARRLEAARRPSNVEDGAGDAAAAGEGEAAAQPHAARVYKPRSDGKPRTGVKLRTDGPSGFTPRGDRPGSDRRGSEGAGERRNFAGKPKFAGKPSFGAKRSYSAKPAFGDERPPRRSFAPRGEGDGSDARPARKTFSKPGTFGRKRDERAGGFTAGRAGGFTAGRAAGDGAPRGERAGREESGVKRVYRKFDAPKFDRPRFDGPKLAVRKSGPRKLDGDKPEARKFDGARPKRPRERSERPARSFSSDRPARAEGAGGRAGRPSGDFAPRKFAGKPGGKPFAKPGGFGAKVGGKSFAKPTGRSAGGGFAGKKPFGKKPGAAFGGKPASTFAKFAGGKKPFGKRPPARKFKPREGESA